VWASCQPYTHYKDIRHDCVTQGARCMSNPAPCCKHRQLVQQAKMQPQLATASTQPNGKWHCLLLSLPSAVNSCWSLTSMFQVATICLQRRKSFVPAKNISSATARRLAACIAMCMATAVNDGVELLHLKHAVSHHIVMKRGTMLLGESKLLTHHMDLPSKCCLVINTSRDAQRKSSSRGRGVTYSALGTCSP